MNICIPANMGMIYQIYRSIQDLLANSPPLPDDIEFVIEVRTLDTGEVYGCYYLASWNMRVIMWAEEAEIACLALERRSVYCDAHLSEHHGSPLEIKTLTS